MYRSLLTKIALAVIFSALSVPTLAHTGAAVSYSFTDGFMHPWLGADHLLVIFAVGLVGRMVSGSSYWHLPLCFMIAMGAGALYQFAGLTLADAEWWVSLSVLFVGLVLGFKADMPLAWAFPLVGFFGLCHGYVHAAETGAHSDQIVYAAGFLFSTALLLCLSMATRWLCASHFKQLRIGYGLASILSGFELLTGF